ncbi:hypothetical protein [Lentzea sp. NPDC051838]|uniref:hypothetical protein n=1 Tax=Lentzea sp. NPDC051838 TaxID=3154849 RepID=UPI00341C92C5
MTDPQNPPQSPSPWSNPENPQWQSPPVSSYQVQSVNNMGIPMPPLGPVPPQELPPQRPATITAAMWIWIAGAVLSVAVLPVMFLTNAEYFLASDPTVDRTTGQFGVGVLAVLSGFLMLVAAAPYIAFAIVLRNGQNWARVLLAVLGAIGFLSTLGIAFIALAADVWQPATAIAIVTLGLTVAAVVLQFLPASNRFVR